NLLRTTAGGQAVFLTQAGLQEVVVVTSALVQFSGVGIQLSIRVHQIGTGHGGTRQVTRAGRCKYGARYFIKHRVTQIITLEIGGTSYVVKEVGAGKQSSILMRHVRVLKVGRKLPIGGSGSIHPVTYRVIDREPGMFVDVFRIGDFVETKRSGIVHAPAAVESYAGFTLGSLFGGDHQYPVGTSRTINGRRSSVFQDRNTFDILGVEGRKYVGMLGRHAVNYDQGVGAVLAGRSCTTKTDTHVKTRLTVDRSHLDTRHGSLQCAGYR